MQQQLRIVYLITLFYQQWQEGSTGQKERKQKASVSQTHSSSSGTSAITTGAAVLRTVFSRATSSSSSVDAEADNDGPEAEAALGGVVWWLGSRLSSDGRFEDKSRFSNDLFLSFFLSFSSCSLCAY